jgi:hypothetical protein
MTDRPYCTGNAEVITIDVLAATTARIAIALECFHELAAP